MRVQPQAKPRVFISYAHACSTERLHAVAIDKLRVHLNAEVFYDTQSLEPGDLWLDKLQRELRRADVTIFMVCEHFLKSDFISAQEVPPALDKAIIGNQQIIPLYLGKCNWGQAWISRYQMRPAQPLDTMSDHELDCEFTEIARQIDDRHVALEHPRDEVLAVRDLLHEAVYRGRTAESHNPAGEVALGLSKRRWPLGLFDVARFCVEHDLLANEDSFLLPQAYGAAPDCDRIRKALDAAARERAPLPQGSLVIDVSHEFFERARDREEDWLTYFEAVEPGSEPSEALEFRRERVSSLCHIAVKCGYVASQYLLAGLLSRFEDDWEPVLEAYARRSYSLAEPRFQSLQASQWSCWLLWGPSIPLCTCTEWTAGAAVSALQYGYGDENNSVPLLDARESSPEEWGRYFGGLHGSHTRAAAVGIWGRLRWGPWCLHRDPSVARPGSKKIQVAPAQRALWQTNEHRNKNHTDGLFLQAEQRPKVLGRQVAYFSAYLWIMFWVGVRVGEGEYRGVSKKTAYRTPQTLADLEDWPDRVWEDLLPVFVHANIADPQALHDQMNLLADQSIALLTRLSERTADFFPERDRNNVCFVMVGASDYSGCGEPLMRPPPVLLQDLLHERRERRQHGSLRKRLVLPQDRVDVPGQPPGDVLFRAFFSTCHLPQLVQNYYQFVDRA